MNLKDVLLAFVLSLYHLNLYCQVSEFSKVPIDLSLRTSDIFAIDLDADGEIDIVSSSLDDNKLAWYKNMGNETFGPQQVIAITTQSVNTFIVVDMDSDGDFDILGGTINTVGSSTLSNNLFWIENVGNGNFGSEQIISSTLQGDVTDIEVSDLDSDGDLDIVSSSGSSNEVSYYENLGSNLFASQVVIADTCIGARALELADVDNDGDKDILVCSYFDETLSWYKNDGSGVFSLGVDLLLSVPKIYDVRAFDYDGDSDIDIFVSSRGSISNVNGRLRLLENQGNGNFNTISSSSSGFSCTEILPVDVDGDLDLDLLIQLSGGIVWLENNGSNSLSKTLIHSIGQRGGLISAGDINLDGNIDIIGVAGVAGTIFWKENTGSNGFELSKIVTSNAHKNHDMTIFDVDQDGKEDVVYCSFEGNNVSWYKNLGAGNYDYIRHITDSIERPLCLTFDEIDNDGLEDLIVGTLDGQLVWYKNLGNGNFSDVKIIMDNDSIYWEIHLDDLDGDGDQDILVKGSIGSSSLHAEARVIENLGSGNFGDEIILPGLGSNVTSLATGDLDSDGDVDVAITSIYNGVRWLQNDGTGALDNLTEIQINMTNVTDLKIADFDNDGDFDIATISTFQDNIMWLENLGGGNFSSQNDLSTNVTEPISLNALDMDGDNDIDIVVGSNSSSGLVWFENFGGFFSSELLLANSYPNSVKLSDMDTDGDPEIIFIDQNGVINQQNNYSTNTIEINGKLYIDFNLNNTFDSTDYGINFISVGAIPQSDYTFSFGNGDYFMSFSDTNSSYVIQPDSIPYWSIVSDSAFYTVVVDTTSSTYSNRDFAFSPDTVITVVEIDLSGQQARCNTTVNYWVNIRNIGTTIPSGVICLELDSAIAYGNCSVNPDSIVGHKIYWSYDSLFFFQSHNFFCEVALPDWTFMGDTMISVLSVSADTLITGSVQNMENDTLFQIITCAYDPNDKIGYPYGIDSMGYILENTESIEYNIRFQNTGTDTAQNIIISDDLDPNLDWTSLDLISSSHNVHAFVDLLGRVSFTFNNIQLPDSIVNEPASNGYVKFKIDLLDSLPVGTSIYNTARIFFDQNPPIITNTEIHTTYNCETIIASIEAPGLFCNNNNHNFSAHFKNNPSNANYYWDLNLIGTSDSSSFIINPDTTGIFSLYASVNTDFCSSDTTLNIQIGTLDSILLNTITICSNDSALIFNNYESDSGYYHNVLSSNQFGCDSVLTLYLKVIPVSIGFVDSLEICEGDSILVFSNYQTEAGTYYDSLNNILGCDSVLTTYLEVIPNSIGFVDSMEICEGDSALVFGTYQAKAGVYHDSLNNILGCDSVLTFYLNVIPSSIELVDSLEICQGDSIIVFGAFVMDAGNYYDTLSSVFGCDSILSIQVFVNDFSVYYNELHNDTLCLENKNYPFNATIGSGEFVGPGVVGMGFNSEMAGTGTHLITHSYTDSTGCYNIDSIKITVQDCLYSIKMFPNPTSGIVNLVNDYNETFDIKIINSLGQVIHYKENILSQNYSFEIDSNSGVYIVEIEFQNRVFRRKIIKY